MDWSFIQRFTPMYVEAAGLTLRMGLMGVALSMVLGLGCCLALHYRAPVLRQIAAQSHDVVYSQLLVRLDHILYKFMAGVDAGQVREDFAAEIAVDTVGQFHGEAAVAAGCRAVGYADEIRPQGCDDPGGILYAFKGGFLFGRKYLKGECDFVLL